MVTEFPIFSKLTFKDKRFLDTFNAQFPSYADWAFGTLMTWWDVFDDLEVSLLNDNLVVKSSYLSMGEAPRLVLLGTTAIDATMEILFEYQKSLGQAPTLYSLPQYTIDAIAHPEHYSIVEDPNAAEYIISTDMHATLEGPSMYKTRQRIAQFRKSTEGHTVEFTHMNLDNLPAKMRLINSLHTWHDIYKNDAERLEGIVIDRALLTAEHIGLNCLVLLIDKEIRGFALYKYLPRQSINVNHIKVSYVYDGIFSAMTQALASYVQRENVTTINFEQDLGIPGLRFHKQHLRPIRMFRKYDVNPKKSA